MADLSSTTFVDGSFMSRRRYSSTALSITFPKFSAIGKISSMVGSCDLTIELQLLSANPGHLSLGYCTGQIGSDHFAQSLFDGVDHEGYDAMI